MKDASRSRVLRLGAALLLAVGALVGARPAPAVHAQYPVARAAGAGPIVTRNRKPTGSTAALVIASAATVSPALLTPANLRLLGRQFHNVVGLGPGRHVVPLPVLLLGSAATPDVRAVLAAIRRQKPVRIYLLGMTHNQRLTIVTNTLPDNIAIYINRAPGQLRTLAALRGGLTAARHFVPVITRTRGGALGLANAQQVAADTPLPIPSGTIPSSYALNPALLPPVGNQGQEGSCVGWSTSYYYKSFQEAREHHWSLSDPNHLFSPSFVYNQINMGRDEGKDGGASAADAMALLTQEGDVPIARFPYVEKDVVTQPTQALIDSGAPFQARDFGYLFKPHTQSEYLPYHNDITGLKHWLASGDGLVIQMTLFPSFESYQGGVYDADVSGEQPAGGHAMFVVGYDDNAEGTGIGAFKIENSWGPAWGEQGYVWISYRLVSQYADSAWAMYDQLNDPLSRPTPSPTPIPVATPSPTPAQPQPQPAPVIYTTAASHYTLAPDPNKADFLGALDFVFQAVQDNKIVEEHYKLYVVEVPANSDQIFSLDYVMNDGTKVTAQVEVQAPAYPQAR